ncbi:hypothetical protein [Cloacibacillus porcorum]
MSEDIKKDETRNVSKEHGEHEQGEYMVKEPVAKPLWNRTAMVIFFITAFALVGVWCVAAKQ